MWYDKYFKWYQRKNVFDVYLDKRGDEEHEYLTVVLVNGNKGCKWLYYGNQVILGKALQQAYRNALEIPLYEDDFEKYLKPTIGTTRPDVNLISNFEKGYTPCH